MKVKELIDRLKKYDSDATVIVDCYGSIEGIQNVSEDDGEVMIEGDRT